MKDVASQIRRLVALVVCCLPAALICAQTTGSIAGTVKDPVGAVIVGAQVSAESPTGEVRIAETSAVGSFVFPLLAPGKYRITVSASSFQSENLENVLVSVTETTRLDVTLGFRGANDSVSVSANSDLLRTDSPSLGRVVHDDAIAELPLATRNFTQLLSLSPGTATYLPDSTGLGRNTQAISANGARVTQNNYQVNGVDANGLGTNGPVLLPVPAPEAIQEFNVQTSLYDATYGRAGGANIQIVTRSGGNVWHGSAYEYLRHNALNANDSFLKSAGEPRPELRRNVFGATVGGPLRADHVFLFVSYQGAREINGASLINSISSDVLVAPGLTNDRSSSTLLATFHPTASNGKPVTTIDRAALALLNARLPDGTFLIPTPRADGHYTGSARSSFNEDQFNSNFDFNFSPRDTLWAKFFFSTMSQYAALPSFKGTGPNVPGFGTDGNFDNRLLALQETHTFNASAINEARAGYTLNRNNSFPREPITDTQAGIVRANAGEYPGLPLIRIAQPAGGVVIGTAAQAFSLSAPATFTLNDTVSIVHGRHSIRSGAELRYNLINFQSTNLVRGQIDFADFNSFLAGNVRTSTAGDGIVRANWRAFDYNFFVQDDWRISPRLVVNAGLRYELDLPVYDSHGRLATFDPSLYRPPTKVNASGVPIGPPAGGLIQAGNAIPAFNVAGLPKGENSLLHGNDPIDLGPRVGFAASVFRSLVLRGGYGLFFSRPTFQYTSNSVTLPPYYVLGVRSTSPIPLADPFLALPAASQFPTIVSGVALAGTAFDRNLRVPYFHQFNLTTQYQLAGNWLLEAGYVGSRGRRLFRQEAVNQAQLASAQHPVTNAATGAVITTNSDDNAQLRAPFQGVSITSFFMNRSDGESSYDSLQVSLVRRLARGLQLLGSYTFAKSIDDDSGAGGGAGAAGLVNPAQVGDSAAVLGDQLSRRANRGVSDFNRAHRFVVSSVWDLPQPGFVRDKPLARHLLAHWRASGVLTAMSGLPIDIVDTGSGSLYGLSKGSSPMARPSLLDGSTCHPAERNLPPGYFFNPFAFRSPVVPAGQVIPSSGGTAVASSAGTDIGNVPRNCLVGPRQTNLDFGVTKSFRVTESATAEFRVESFNLLNHPNLANPISNLNAVNSSGTLDGTTGQVIRPGTFGRIVSTSANPRLIQLAFRFLF